MDTLRSAFDVFYDKIKPIIFKVTEKDPHQVF